MSRTKQNLQSAVLKACVPDWSAASIALQPGHLKEDFLQSLNLKEIEYILHDWSFWAHPHQKAPEGRWRLWVLLGGRGAGKTRAGAEWLRKHMVEEKESPKRAALIAPTLSDVREVMLEGPSGLLKIGSEHERPTYEPSRRRLVWPNGSEAYAFSSEDPDSLRGPQFHFAWADEFCAWSYPEKAWSMLQFGLRLGENPRAMITTTPRPVKVLKKILKAKDTVLTHAPSHVNAAHLAPNFIETMENMYGNSVLRRQELDGEIINDPPGALWTRDLLALAYDPAPPSLEDFDTITVGVDPTVTSHEKSCACGIIVAGRYKERSWILADHTLQGASPSQWAEAAVRACRHYNAGRLVAEVNQGGDLIEQMIRLVDSEVPFQAVRAHRSKRARAEPIALLYERGLIHHVKGLTRLEDEMCSFGAFTGMGGKTSSSSPDRVDALVWVLGDLMLHRGEHPRLRSL